MKKIIVSLFLVFFIYAAGVHNSAVAFYVSHHSTQERDGDCHPTHTKTQTHKCCFISDIAHENTPGNFIQTSGEKIKKQTFSFTDFKNQDFSEIQTYVLPPPNGPPKESQTNLYTSLIGIIKQQK